MALHFAVLIILLAIPVIIFTSANLSCGDNVIPITPSVCLSVSVCICLCTRYLKKLLTNLNQIMWNDRPSAKDQTVRFWFWCGCGPGYRLIFHFYNILGLGLIRIQSQFFHFSIIERYGWMIMKLLGAVKSLRIRNIWLDFRNDPDPHDPNPDLFFTFPSLRDRAETECSVDA